MELDGTGRRWTKVPYQPGKSSAKAKSNDPSTWAGHADAVAAVEAEKADGIGFMLAGSDYGAFDLDDCRDPATGAIEPWARELIDRAGSYTEITVSGTGLRIIGSAKGGHVHRKHDWPGTEGSIETYRKAVRFIVVTGYPLAGTAQHLANIDQLIDETITALDERRQSSADPARVPASEPASLAALPTALRVLIEGGAPIGERSTQFHRVVRWLAEVGWSEDGISSLLQRFPDGIAAKYRGRIPQEVGRSLAGLPPNAAPASGIDGHGQDNQPRLLELHWHGEAPAEPRPWLVEGIVPATGKGLLAGQWGTAKTFVALDLAASVMTGGTFAGRPVKRIGGVLFIAAEGANEIPIRLRALADHKLKPQLEARPAAASVDLSHLPFGWVEECPQLLADRGALGALLAVAKRAEEQIRTAHGMPLALVVVDTIAASAGFTSENDSAEGQKVMNALEELSRLTGAFVVGIDHFGKLVETGTRGTSAKEAAADMVLALLADRELSGKTTNMRMAIRKLRGGSAGTEHPFDLRVVTLSSDTLMKETSCVIDWRTTSPREPPPSGPGGPRWAPSLRILRAAMRQALGQHGKEVRPFGDEGPQVRAVTHQELRSEFGAGYPADGDDPRKRADAKRKAFNRALKQALERNLVISREIDGIDHLWFSEKSDEAEVHKSDGPDTP